MGKCKHFEICQLSADLDDDGEYCILHSFKPDKNKENFNEALKNHKKYIGSKFRYFVFPDTANFRGENFKDIADFRNTEFKKACFLEAEFEQGAKFLHSVFSKETDFSKAKFLKEVSFRDSNFNAAANFEGCYFKEKVNFYKATFKGRTIFSEVHKIRNGREVSIPIFDKIEVNFKNVNVDPLGALIFRGADLKKTEFIGTELQKAEFTRVQWHTAHNRIALYDECLILNDVSSRKKEKSKKYSQNIAWHDVEKIYRDLKKNHEERKDMVMAGDFHIGEKEMQRLNKNNSWTLRWLLLFPYRIFSGYGESYLRPLFWSGSLLLLCTFGYLIPGFAVKDCNPLSVEDWRDWLRSAHFSLQTMFLIKSMEITPIWIGKGLKTIETLLGPFFLGLFALAVRQRLQR